MKKEFDLSQFETLIRLGKAAQVRNAFGEINWSKVPRKELAVYANLLRRAGDPATVVRFLNPIVRSEKKAIVATAGEKAEYALSLAKLGGFREALKILDTVKDREFYDLNLYKSMCMTPQWDYDSAATLLYEYVENADPGYWKFVGQINLAAALIFQEKFDEAEAQVNEVVSQAERLGLLLLSANCNELKGQIDYGRGRWNAAAKSFETAAGHLSRAGNLDELWIKKWLAIVSLKKEPGPESLKELSAVRARAVEMAHWETVRDCDYRRAIVSPESTLVAHLYHGTPFEGFRRRMQRAIPTATSVLPKYMWNVARGAESPGGELPIRWFDLHECVDQNGGNSLKEGRLLTKLLRLLASDFYRPLPLVSIFSETFYPEHFNPVHSPNRVHQLLQRMRVWFDSNDIPLEIAADRTGFRLHAETHYGLKLSLEKERSADEALISKIRAQWSDQSFSAAEAASHLEVSRDTVLNVLKDGIKTGAAVKEGAGPHTKYRLVG